MTAQWAARLVAIAPHVLEPAELRSPVAGCRRRCFLRSFDAPQIRELSPLRRKSLHRRQQH